MNTFFNKTLKANARRGGTHPILSLISWVLVCWLSTAALTQPVQAAATNWLTLVSLTFDDGLTESAARDILAKHGMQGTFYVNSDEIGNGGYLSKAELDGLYADGNEIGGHTIGHVDLATLSAAAQKTAICNDMQNLVDWGYPVHSFAYPFSSTGSNTQSIMASGCSAGTYESARAVGGLVTQNGCNNCPFAETIPPANPYYIATNESIKSTTTLTTLQGYVTQAESNGGGWVPLVFHRICEGCDTYAVSPAMLDTFLTWLKARESQGTYVRTVHEVMSGDSPSPPLPPQLGPNQLINPSLELDADKNNQADCWTRNGSGSNRSTWTRINGVTKAHTGSFAEQLKITSYSSGDQKLLSTLDAGQPSGCAPAVVAGKSYQISAWYKSTVSANVALFYLDATGVWQYWRDGSGLPASTAWTQMIQYTGIVPAGAQAISFGLSLTQKGTLTTDDYSMAQVLDGPPPDTTPPVIADFAPANGASVSSTVALTATVTDTVAMQRVEFLINGAVIATATTSPYVGSWDSKSVANGSVTYAVQAFDAAGNKAVAAGHQLTVANIPTDNSPPVISSFVPVNGTTVSGTVALTAVATDNVAVQRVEFLINTVVIATDTSSPYAGSWNSKVASNGPVTYAVRAFDTAGNSTIITAVNLTVNNSASAGNLLTNPSLELDANNDGIADCWQRAGYGTNTFIWTRVSGSANAHNGNFAESLQITKLTSGDRKLVSSLDSSACAPVITVGSRYNLSGWYKSTIATEIVVYYRTSAGVWQFWQSSPVLAAKSSWTQASYTTPVIPAGATAISFGFGLGGVGTLITDDYEMVLAP